MKQSLNEHPLAVNPDPKAQVLVNAPALRRLGADAKDEAKMASSQGFFLELRNFKIPVRVPSRVL